MIDYAFYREILVKFFADWSGYVLIGLILTWMLYKIVQNPNSKKGGFVALAQMGAAAFLSRGIITEAIRFFWHRQRPSFLPEASFPSGHAAFYFAIATVAYAYNKKLGIVCFGIAGLMGFARVFAGYHWPSDIVGGAAVGILSGAVIMKFFNFFAKKHAYQA